MEDPEMYSRMKTAFYAKMEEIINEKHSNNQIFTQAAYMTMIANVEHAKSLKFGKTPKDYARLKKFDILEIDGCKRLVVPFFCSTSSSGSKTSGSIRMFVYVDEIFDILHTAHLKTGHKRRGGMTQEISQFKNITREMIQTYLNICEVCNEKYASKMQEKDPKMSFIDFIGMPKDKNGYNLILVHIDVKTHFVQLRPLKNTDATEVTRSLLDIFTIFGPPDVLQGNIANIFGERIVTDILCQWSEINLAFIKTEGKVELLEESRIKITQLLNAWIESNRSLAWSEGVKFVQYIKNKQYDKTLTRSAGEAMFNLNRFGRILEKKRTSEVIDQAPSDQETEEQTGSGIDDTQNQQDQDTSKRARVDEAQTPNIIIQKIETVDNETGTLSSYTWQT